VTTLRRPAHADRPSIIRTWHDAVLIGVGAIALVLSALPVSAHSISSAETDVFRALNNHTVLPFTVVWVVMQLGNFVAVPIAALAAAVLRRTRLALAIVFGGLMTYYLAKVVKSIVERGRPAGVLDDVHIRGAASAGRGYVSGHAAVVTLLVVLVWPYVGRPWRAAAVAAALFVCLARVNVGAHLPLDIVGGAAVGLAVGGVTRLIFGRPGS
jgi:undecaprenyl-diphosphatase